MSGQAARACTCVHRTTTKAPSRSPLAAARARTSREAGNLMSRATYAQRSISSVGLEGFIRVGPRSFVLFFGRLFLLS